MTRSRRTTLLSVLAFVAMTAVVTFRTWHNVNVPGRADLPLYYALADAFTLCDHYFCSALGPTGPNRHYATAATSPC